MRIEQVKIFQEVSYTTIEEKFNAWVRERLAARKELPSSEEEHETLEIPSNTHLQYDSSLQKYIFTVVYLEEVGDPKEEKTPEPA